MQTDPSEKKRLAVLLLLLLLQTLRGAGGKRAPWKDVMQGAYTHTSRSPSIRRSQARSTGNLNTNRCLNAAVHQSTVSRLGKMLDIPYEVSFPCCPVGINDGRKIKR